MRVEAVKSTATVDDTFMRVKDFSHTRIPVFEKTIDDIEWIVSYRELVQYREQ